ncbi:DUF4158 domain-containing protein [Bacillus cereus]|uniref:DUF4158 domain-containing protein n=1 Tax=Bacillus cereus TaxID=1396 RepID=UPI00214FFDDE|nr:DUF4158 domain-containing protein [Bacillus cereus]
MKHNLSSVYTRTRSEIEWTSLKTKGTLQQLALLILLKTVQNLGFFTRISDIPPIIIKHIAQTVQLPVPIETEWEARFWCKDKIKGNITHIFRAQLSFMLLAQTIDGLILSDFEQNDLVNQSVLF